MKRSTVILLALAVVGTLVLPLAATAAPTVREYFIAADEVQWNYAPSYPTNLMTGQPFTAAQQVFVNDFIGRVYTKSIYREYTDGTFSTLKTRGADEEHLGTLGPVIRASVGDTIIVHFKNNTTHDASVHPHGVFYTKANEGAPYEDGSAEAGDGRVAPGNEYTYTWDVPKRAGPAKNDPSSIVWLYHSHADETADTNAGLIGAMVVTKKGKARADGSPKDVDREFFSLFTVFDENVSVHLAANEASWGGTVPVGQEADFEESNLMHGINGLVYGNNTGYNAFVGERVRWYVMAMGTEVDLHTPHWHGVTLVYNGNRLDVSELLPAAAKTLDLDADNPGTWMFHCHVNDHLEAGMMTKFTISP